MHKLSSPNCLWLCFALLLASCSAAPPTALQPVRVYATSAARLWLAEVYACADDLNLAIQLDAEQPELYLQLGDAQNKSAWAYQIGIEEIWVVTNPAIEADELSSVDVRGIFAQGNPSLQVWVFSPGADIQQMFDQLALSGSRVTSTAKVAADVGQMSAMLNSQLNAVGILPGRALTGGVHAAYLVGRAPMLAFADSEPQGAVAALLDCLQR